MTNELTLLHYWEELTEKQRRLIWDVLRSNSSKRYGMSMGLLPFIPVKEIKVLLLRQPESPWSQYLFSQIPPAEMWDNINSQTLRRYHRSRQHDQNDYTDILKILMRTPQQKSQLAVFLELWKERNQHEQNG